ncbi:MAG: tetratricopeptide repeat protein [Myxococcaceae bacterium]|jgi:cytochrome c-type biogenesis protein CcmH/NrfG|nr:tetratricopeptide repeat protein [Myxococcaceae bacterium]
MKSPRKPTPVQVVYFPKKATRTVSRTQTIPELFLGDDPKTEEIDTGDLKRTRRRTKSGSFARVTLSDETKAPEQNEAHADMAALGHELFSRGRVAEAKVIFEGLAANAADAFTFTMLGTIHLAQNELDKALGRFEEALQLDPDDLAALVYRAEIRLQKKRFRQAIDDLQRAVGLGSAGEPFVDRARRLLQMARRAMKR